MGIRVSIDKHVSNLEELLEMSPAYFSKLKFESKVDANIHQHLKVRSPDSLTKIRSGGSAKTNQSSTR